MAANHKLTGVLQGWRIVQVAPGTDALTITYDGGAVMTVRTAMPPSVAPVGKTVRAVRQAGTKLSLDLGDESSWDISTAEETSSVIVRDSAGKLIYAD